MPHKLLLILSLLLSAIAVYPQSPTPTPKPEEVEKLKKASLEFLKETSAEVGRMRSIENRISFSAELASLLWFHDANEAKAMYALAITDLKQLLMELDAQMNAATMPLDDEYMGISPLLGGYGRSPAERKLRIAMSVRQQMALGLAEHDAEQAYAFFYDTGIIISNEKFRKETEQQDKYFEFQLLKTIADTSAAKAASLGALSLKDGVNSNHIEILKKIHAKDAEKGIEFGQAVFSALKSKKSRDEMSPYIFSTLLKFGSESLAASRKPSGKKPVYTQTELRDIADLFAQILLDSENTESVFSAELYIDEIEKYSPARAAQIRSKVGAKSLSMGIGTGGSNMNRPPNRNAMKVSVNSVNAVGVEDTAETAAALREAAEKKMMDAVEKLGKPLPKDERDKVIAETRKIISQTPGKDKKIVALSMLAAHVARLGDKELADEVMRDAEQLVNPQPKNYRDFMMTWMLASGYANANPTKAFPLLEGSIGRVNETLAAFVKVAEFMDVNEEMISDGEVQVGAFGGSMLRGITRDLGIANATLMSLARADFAKTKALTNTFDRVEVRVLAKMLVLRSILDEKKPAKIEGGDGDIEVETAIR